MKEMRWQRSSDKPICGAGALRSYGYQSSTWAGRVREKGERGKEGGRGRESGGRERWGKRGEREERVLGERNRGERLFKGTQAP